MASPFEYEKKSSSGLKIGLAIGGVAAIAAGVVLYQQFNSSSGKPVRRAEPPVVMIKSLPPPPPPPPPPQNVPPRQDEQQQQTTVSEEDMKPAEAAPADPSPALGTGVVGNGPADGFGLRGKDNGRIGGTGAGGSGGGSRFGGYFTQVVQSVNEALARHAATRNASFDVPVRLWTDATGRITKVKLMRSTGNAELDAALRTQVFASVQLPDIPSGMRMPLEIRASARRPN